ncbi:protein GL2-INTERACTING REPRESSOR 1-like [Malania oleifera]|uniref:protein GL2-INTERACTING REPRESSOR 1-like n=1 Tax=Malania oleifera TaxID=397392 RepID=UPI0025ADB1DE|nr:protein GL2-INTERACTING REPRESSOR 1-like [Malania oleifera]XP_057954497.1 protein GL2-INTERACTING REPRESSOR 1-like [Malania oleifera]
MGRKANGPKLELKLNLAPPPRPNLREQSPNLSSASSSTSSEMTLPSSCLSSEIDADDASGGFSSSPEETSAMVLVGCPRCLMYVMLSEVDPRCPRCKSSVLLDFLHEEKTLKKRN